MSDCDIAVIGGGVVGLAVAARLAADGDAVVLLERRERLGTETSSRNSEVVHAGLYYPPGSLKARLCVAGNRAIWALGERGVPCRRTGKIVTAVERDELPALEALLERGRANGAELHPLTADQARALEPEVSSVGALHSPASGIVSAHGLMDYFRARALERDAILQTRADVVGLERPSADYRLTVRSGDASETLSCARVVNAAGLGADDVAALAGIDVEAAGYRQHYVKGSYFAIRPARAGLTRQLVYPVPGRHSLGVHAVIGLDGRLRFGPDVEYLAERRQDYAVDPARRSAFGAAVRRLFPSVRDDDLTPDTSGIRPKLQAEGDPPRDFLIREESDRGLPGFVDLLGIDSPGLTAAAAIADHVAGLFR